MVSFYSNNGCPKLKQLVCKRTEALVSSLQCNSLTTRKTIEEQESVLSYVHQK